MNIIKGIKLAGFLTGIIVLMCVPVLAQAPVANVPSAAAEKPEEKKAANPIIDVPGGVFAALYGGFDGFGDMFDGFVTGDKSPRGSNKGKQDPGPITSYQGRYGQLMQFDYGVEGTNRFAEQDTGR